MKKFPALLAAGSVAIALTVIALDGCGNKASSPTSSLTRKGATDSDDENPQYTSSIKVPDPEPANLAALATISADAAKTAALSAYPGTSVVKAELENENGNLVYGIELNNGMDVKVDAGNATVLHSEPAGPESGESSGTEAEKDKED